LPFVPIINTEIWLQKESLVKTASSIAQHAAMAPLATLAMLASRKSEKTANATKYAPSALSEM
jgi:hypothetical protein